MQTIVRPTRQDQLADLDIRHVLHPLTNLHAHRVQGPLIWERSEGIELIDADGNRYIDGAAGMWNVNVGHGRSELAEVAAEQMAKLAYASTFGGASNAPSIELAARGSRELRSPISASSVGPLITPGCVFTTSPTARRAV